MDKTVKKIIILPLVLLFFLFSILPGIQGITAHAAYNNELSLKSDIVYMENLDQGTVIFNKNTTKKTAMGSLTKITTAIVVLDNVENLDAQITVKQSVLDTLSYTSGSTEGLAAGEVLTVRQLLNLMMVHNSNEAASVLADYVGGGSIDKFVQMMNDYAKKAGCKNTHYTNPHGLDEDDHYTTAEDLAIISKKALKNDTFKKIVGQSSYTLEATNKRETVTYSNTNYLLNKNSTYYYDACKGIKNGITENAGYCLVSYATKNGYTYLCVVLSGSSVYKEAAGSYNPAFNDTLKAYKWVFKNIKLKVVAEPTDVITVANISLGRKVDTVQLVPKEEITALLPSDVDASGVSVEPVDGSIDPDLKAPVKKGDKIGEAKVLYAGEELCTIDLVAATTVHRGFFTTLGYLLKTLFGSTIVRILVLVLIVVGLIVFLVNYLYKKRKTKANLHVISVHSDAKGRQPIRSITNEQHRTKRQSTQYRKAKGKTKYKR